MTTNTSATGGYITEKPPRPPTAEEIQRALQRMMSVLSGLPGKLVRPRWQPTPPTQPPADTNWAAIGVVQLEADDYPYIVHDGNTTLAGQTAPGVDRMQRHATLTVLASFYGPDCEDTAGAMRDALYVQQNYEPLLPIGIKLRTVHDMMRSPELVNQQYINRIDLRVEFRMQIDRVYPVFNLDAAEVDLHAETWSETITVTPPVP